MLIVLYYVMFNEHVGAWSFGVAKVSSRKLSETPTKERIANVQNNQQNTHRSIYSHDRTWRLPHVAATAHARIMVRGATWPPPVQRNETTEA